LAGESNATCGVNGEAILAAHLIHEWCDTTFPHIAAYEWDYEPGQTQLGRGDLVFSADPIFSADRADRGHLPTSEKGAIVIPDHLPTQVCVMEIKLSSSPAPSHKVHDQVRSSVRAWLKRFPRDTVVGVAVVGSRQEYSVTGMVGFDKVGTLVQMPLPLP
jgi:hypothetical protein